MKMTKGQCLCGAVTVEVPQTYELSAGIFPDDRKRLVSQIYIESKPDFYDFAQQTPMLTE